MSRINHRVKQDGDQIVRRLKTTDVTLEALMAEYRCAYNTIMREIRSRLTDAQWKKIARKRLGRGGKATQFQKGFKPWNKGRKGWQPKGCQATQFKKYEIRGAAARKYRDVGAIQIRYDKPKEGRAGRPGKGIPSRFIKVKDDGRPQDRWIPYARWLWEKEHGPVPKGLFVVHEDGNRMNDKLDNLILVDRRENMRRLYQRPEVMALCRKRAGRATFERHETNRQLKAAGIRKPSNQVIVQCTGCGADVDPDASKCPKCGGWAMERIEVAA